MMRRNVMLPLSLARLAMVALALVAGSLLIDGRTAAAVLTPLPSQDLTQTSGTITCTVRTVDTDTRAIDVMTGVGHSLRIVRMHVHAACQIKDVGLRGELSDIKPGQIVRVQFLPSPAVRQADQPVAQAIEILQSQPEGPSQ